MATKGLLKGLLDGDLEEVPSGIEEVVSDNERYRAIAAVLADLQRSLAKLEAMPGGFHSLSHVALRRKGPARVSVNAAGIVIRCIGSADQALDTAMAGGPAWKEALEGARHFAWLAAVYVGGASALGWMATSRGHRAGSRSTQFAEILKANPELPASRINALLPTPFSDEAHARKLARKLRGPRRVT